MRLPRPAAAAALAAVLAACGDTAPPPPAPKPVDVAFLADLEAFRRQRLQDLMRPDGWTALTGLHWIEPGAHYAGSDRRNGLRLAMAPPHLGMFELRGGRVRFVPERGVPLTLDGAPLRGEAWLRTDADPAGPSRIGFDDGRGGAMVLRRGSRYALRTWHADAPSRLNFSGLAHWPPDDSWRIAAKFVTHPPGRTLEIHDITGNTFAAPNPGRVEFLRDGRTFALEAVEWGGQTLLIFADLTNAKGSYSAGRYLELKREAGTTAVVVDFNRSINPPCAFTPYTTCPLPPSSNRMELAVAAGEKAYTRRRTP